MTAGGIGKFQKAVGDAINPGDVLVEIETDKAQMDFECQEEGFVAKIFVSEGDKDIPVGKVKIYRVCKARTVLINKIKQPIAIFVDDESDVEAFKDFTLEDASPAAAPAAAATEEAAPAAEEKKESAPASAASGSSDGKIRTKTDILNRFSNLNVDSISIDRAKASPLARVSIY